MEKEKKDHIWRLGIDARLYGPKSKGLGRYVKELVDALVKKLETEENFNFQLLIFLNPDNYDEFEAPLNCKKVLAPWPWYSWKEQIFLPRLVKKEKVDLMHYPHFNVPIFSRTPFVVTIHDLILTKFPSTRASTLSPLAYFFKYLAYKLIIKQALRKSLHIITVSKFTKEDLIQQFGTDAKKITSIHLGADYLIFENNLDKQSVLKKHNIQEPYILYVGSAYPHKNLEGLLETFRELKKKEKDLNLVLVGSGDYFLNRLKKEIELEEDLKGSIIFSSNVDDRDLSVLYQSAFFYIFPSFYEGFGLPALEAMANDCPLLCSNQASLPEIAGQAAIFFDPYNKEDFLAKALSFFSEQGASQRESLIKLGKENLKRFSWKRTVDETIEVYKRALRRDF